MFALGFAMGLSVGVIAWQITNIIAIIVNKKGRKS